MRYMCYPNFKKKALTLSYDDGVKQDVRLIEIMVKNGLKGTFNINTGMFNDGERYLNRMTEEEAYKLYAENGMEVAAHAYTHAYLDKLSVNECTYEVLTDKTNIEKATGKITRGMAYPYGTYNDAVVDVLKNCGILFSRTCVTTKNFNIPDDWLRLTSTCHHNEPTLMLLAEKFAQQQVSRNPILFYLWGHSYEFDNNNNWNVIEEFAEYLGDREDIWYATNSEIFEYIEAYKHLRVSNDGRIIYNPTATTLYFDFGNELKYQIKPGETIYL